MAVVNHPNPPYLDADGNSDWPEPEGSWEMEALGNGRSISRGFGGCATCDGGGCGDCR